ncbi:hypothetical protein ACFO0N_17380 [Halobium salinum]|uniref:Domain of unknown function domain-containing protein n=1 Tax=Halobium salinum TaxID=1364940 RepID=A0ABD5PFP2_9EURY|nr:hypothetical protein [Halobium salinum]
MTGKRDRGLLSPADRSYLRGESDLASVQSERNTRGRIRDRVHDGLLDFELLTGALSDRDVELLFEKRLGGDDGTVAFDALVSAVAFLYRGVDHTDLDFEAVLREGVNLAEAREDRAATVTFSKTLHALDTDQLRRKLESDESLSLTEIAYLYEADDLGRDELAKYFGDTRAPELDDGRVQSKVTDY